MVASLSLLSSLALLSAASAATPRFEGPPETVALAEAAWTAAEACTGRSPAVPAVTLVHDLPALKDAGLAGLASFPAGKPGRIRLAENARASTVAHEIAHAWVHTGPRALVEGRTELLARCVQQRAPEHFPGFRDLPSALEFLPDLRAWGGDPTAPKDIDADLHAYLASFRYFRAVAEVVPPERLWAADMTTWEAFEAVILETGPGGKAAVDALRGGADAQRAALLDADLDGLAVLHESFTGTDPARYDTDGDGWWDGAPKERPDGAVPLRQDHHPVCLPRVAAGSEQAVVKLGGALGGDPIPEVLKAAVELGSLVTWRNGWENSPGGVWVVAGGESLVPNPRCALRPGLTIRATEAVEAGALETLIEGVVAAREDLAAAGLPERPLVVTVGGAAMYAEWRGKELLVPASALADPGALARVVAASEATRDLPKLHQAAAAAAIVRVTWPGTPTAVLDAPAYEIAPWTRARTKCGEWPGVLAGTCASPLTR